MGGKNLTYTKEQRELAEHLFQDLLAYEVDPGQRQIIPQDPSSSTPAPFSALLIHPIACHPARPHIHRLVTSRRWAHLSLKEKVIANSQIESPFTIDDLEAYLEEWQTLQRPSRSEWTRQANENEPGGLVSLTSHVYLLGQWVRTYELGQLIHQCPIEGGTLLLTKLTPASNSRKPISLLRKNGDLESRLTHYVPALLWLAQVITA